jgi:hypothetical protein
MDTVRSHAALAIFAVPLSAIRLGAVGGRRGVGPLPPMVARFCLDRSYFGGALG